MSKPIDREEFVRMFLLLKDATCSTSIDIGINWPHEKDPSHEHPDLAICYAEAWLAYLLTLLDCPPPTTQACVDGKYSDYCDAILSCESNFPEE